MKNILTTLTIITIAFVFLKTFDKGLELEARRQCIIAIDTCEKYSDTGACDPKYMKVCDNVKI